MNKAWKDIIFWHQFGATLTMLENALRACRDEPWRDYLLSESTSQSNFGEFWYVSYHTLFGWTFTFRTQLSDLRRQLHSHSASSRREYFRIGYIRKRNF